MSTLQAAAPRLAGTALAPAGSQLVLAEWTAQGSAGDEPLYQAPLHEHPEDEAWYVLEGTLVIRAGEHVHQISAGGAVIVPGGTAPRSSTESLIISPARKPRESTALLPNY
jgi:hypothetical protein